LSKNDDIFSFEQVIYSDVARMEVSGEYTLSASFEGATTHFAEK